MDKVNLSSMFMMLLILLLRMKTRYNPQIKLEYIAQVTEAICQCS